MVLLEDTSVEAATTCAVFDEPSRLRRAVRGEGAGEGVRYVVKSAAKGDMEPDCAGKKDGDKVTVSTRGRRRTQPAQRQPPASVKAQQRQRSGAGSARQPAAQLTAASPALPRLPLPLQADHTAFYTFWSCANDPFEGAEETAEDKVEEKAH